LFYQRSFLKRWWVVERLFARPWLSSYKNEWPSQFVEKCLVQTFNFTFMSSSCLPFQKKTIHEVLPNLMKETKQVYVLPKLVDCISFNKYFWHGYSRGHMLFLLLWS
jgi:hypothetical protein